MRPFIYSSATAAMLIATSASLSAQNWPQWLGPNSDGVSAAKNLPLDWTPDEHTLWKSPLPGRAASTPVLWNDHIILTSPNDGVNTILAFDLKGNELWRTPLGKERPGKNKKASGSNPSPVTDGTFVYVYFKSGDAACLDFSGKIIWKHNLQRDYGKDTLWWDLATSPVLSKDSAIYAVMQEGPSYIVAYDRKTGEVNWKIDRSYDVPKENGQAYTTPIVTTVNGKEIMIVWGADHITAHDLANKGAVIWDCAGMNPDGKPFKRPIASAVIHKDMLVIPFDRASRLAGIKMGGTGDITKTAHVWGTKTVPKSNTLPQSSDVPTPCAKDGRAYVLSDFGSISCLEIATGKILWSGDCGKGRDKFSGSPTIVEDKLVVVRDNGDMYVCQLGDSFKIISRSSIGDPMISRPVFLDGRILLRTDSHLMMIGKK